MRPLFFWLALCCAGNALADIVVRDDTGREVRLSGPARRIVSLAPHITETLYAAGAGERIVGAVEFSDYPEAAKRLPRIGRYDRFDLEAILALKPDLVIVWESGNPSAPVAQLQALGLNIYRSQPNATEDVAADLERFGRLAGTSKVADAAATDFRHRLAGLRRAYSGQPPVRVFYEIWNAPLMTVGKPQIISDAIRLCGGENVFGQLTQMAPTINVEAVLAADPEVIVASGMGGSRPEWLNEWKKWPRLQATARGNLFHIHPDRMQRHTPRLLDGTEALCRFLEAARGKRPKAPVR